MTAATPTRGDWYSTTLDLARIARQHWKPIATLAGAGALAAGLVSVLLPSYYEAGAAFQAESPATSSLGGALGGLASQLSGLPLGSQNTAELLSQVLTTDAVLRRVAEANLPYRGHVGPLSAIFGFQDQNPPLRAYNTVRKLRRALKSDVDIRTGVVHFSIEARTPELALAMAETTLAALNAANVALRQARAAAEEEFTAGRAAFAQHELESAEADLQVFYDRNHTVGNSPALQLDLARLKRNVDMAQQVYVQLRLQNEQAAVQSVRNTPALSVIDPPELPAKRSWPKRRLGVLLGAIIGCGLGLARTAIKGQRSAPGNMPA